MRLALRFGRHDVDRFMREMGSRQFMEWIEFLRLELSPPPKKVSEAEFRANFAGRVQKKRR